MMDKKKTLFLCIPDFPFPARKNGISIRYYPILENLASTHEIHLLSIVEGPISDELLQEANRFCTKVSIYIRKPKQVRVLSKIACRIKTLIPGQIPFEYLRYDDTEIANFIRQETAGIHYNTALTVLVNYQSAIKKIISADRYTLDVIDSPYSTRLRKQGPGLFARYDGWLTKLWERQALSSVDYACYISPLDREIGAGSGFDDAKVGVIPNGLYIQDHTSERIDFGGKTLGYLGHMAYPPNIKAALRLYKIFKATGVDKENCKLVIIGRDPAQEIQALKADPSVVVTGEVDNIWPYINGVDIFVFPMEIGSGQQNKLLEAMGAGKPVISTSLGNSGIGAAHQREILIADSDKEIGEAIGTLLKDQMLFSDIGQAAKAYVTATYSWSAIFLKINSHLVK